MCYVYLLRLWWIANFVYFYHLGIEMNNLETRLMLDNLRSELNNFKMEVHLEMRMNRVKQTDSTAVAGMLSTLSADIRSDLASLLKRQDMLFHKQDQIQCTLSGETPPASHSGGFQSPPSSSVLTWSSVPSNTPRQPSKSPLHPPSMIQQQGLPLQSAVGLPEESSEYPYGFNDISSSPLEEDLYQSSLSDAPVARSELGALLAETLSEPLAGTSLQPKFQALAPPRPASTLGMEYPLPDQLVGRPPPVMPQSMTSSPFVHQQSSSHAIQHIPSVTLAADLPPPHKKARLDLRPEDSGHSTSLKDPQVVVRKYADLANVADMGKLACMLARQSYFGDDVLKVSTVHGKSAQYHALNPQKLSALLATIHGLLQFREKSKQEFSLLYTPKINSSLSRLCMNLRKI